ncbi:MAG: hypothetical protein RIT28_4073 [Pseudomonadota bacterium]
MRQIVLVIGWVLGWSVAAAEPEVPVVGAPTSAQPTAEGASEGVVEVKRAEVTPKSREVPRYPAEARLMSTEGSCKVRIILDTTGQPERVEVLACDPYFIWTSVDAAMKSRFHPVIVNGEPVRAAFIYVYKFKLSGDGPPPPPPPVLDPPFVIEALPPIPEGRFREVSFTELTCDQLAQVAFPEQALAAGFESQCRVMLYFNAQGEVIHTEPLACGEPFISAVSAPDQPFLCQPMERRGAAIPVKTEYTFNFEIR